MKCLISILILVNFVCACSNDAKVKQIKIRDLKGFDDFKLYFDCDSVPMLKKVIDDSILIWTSGSYTAISKKEALDYLKNAQYGKTIYFDYLDQGKTLCIGELQETKFLFKNDSLYQIEETKPKLIFHPKMFEKDSVVVLPVQFNFMKDKIKLERVWNLNGRKCYCIRILNVGTSYSFTFDEKINFVTWEGCKDIN